MVCSWAANKNNVRITVIFYSVPRSLLQDTDLVSDEVGENMFIFAINMDSFTRLLSRKENITSMKCINLVSSHHD
jgi:hypothetical protein